MNQTTTLPSFAPGAASPSPSPSPSATHLAVVETLQSRFALRVTSRLSESTESLSPEIIERLRFGREQALQRARAARPTAAEASVAVGRGGVLTLGRMRSASQGSESKHSASKYRGWWLKLASVLPVFALVAGLILIERWQDNSQISVAADIDAALLSDDLPPTAYSDAGFAEFLKTPSE